MTRILQLEYPRSMQTFSAWVFQAFRFRERKRDWHSMLLARPSQSNTYK